MIIEIESIIGLKLKYKINKINTLLSPAHNACITSLSKWFP